MSPRCRLSARPVNRPDDPTLYEPEPLLRHFSECLLHQVVAGTPSTDAFDKRLAGSLLYDCLHPSRSSGLHPYGRLLGGHRTAPRRVQAVAILAHSPRRDAHQRRLHTLLPPGRGRSRGRRLLAASLPGRRQERPVVSGEPRRVLATQPESPRRGARPLGASFERQLLLALGAAADLSRHLGRPRHGPPDRPHTDVGPGVRLPPGARWVLEDACHRRRPGGRPRVGAGPGSASRPRPARRRAPPSSATT